MSTGEPRASALAVGDRAIVEVARVATGGEGVARAPDGRTTFVSGALPGETVAVEITDVRRRHARAATVEVLTASSQRRRPPCPHVADGCGGCDWQHAADELQDEMRLAIVRDALARVGRLPDAAVESGPRLPRAAARTTVRAVVVDGRAGFRRRRSHDALVVGSCLVAHPAVVDLLVHGRFDGAREVVLRVGARTGERLVVVDPTAVEVEVPPGVVAVGTDELAAGAAAAHHEEVAGRRWRISARSFFQPSPEAADALVAEVGAAAESATRRGRLVDLAAGVGLFAGTVGDGFDEVVAVEPSPSAVADARHNLGDAVEVERTTVERWTARSADVVVADPPRGGLGREGVDRVAATGAEVVVLVSCDAGALGRDAGLLVAAGYGHAGSRVLAAFPQTSHVEVVTRFVR